MNATSGHAPAGWYTDPTNSQQLRWWDGTAWGEQIHMQGLETPRMPSQHVSASNVRPLLPEGTKIHSVFVWLLAVWPAIASILLMIWSFYFASSLSAIPHELWRYLETDYMGSGTAGVLFLSTLGVFVGLFFWLIVVLFAFFDYRFLKRQGVVRPFHWAWTILDPIIYIIGRGVVLYKVTPKKGLAPIWTWIGANVVGALFLLTWFFYIALRLGTSF